MQDQKPPVRLVSNPGPGESYVRDAFIRAGETGKAQEAEIGAELMRLERWRRPRRGPSLLERLAAWVGL